ncbi:MAG: alpha/beta fold hydrolase [Pseudomonadota bacterium]
MQFFLAEIDVSGTTTKTEFDGAQGKLAAALELPSGAPRAFALFAHCFSCSKDIKAAREIARALRRSGFAVLRFDFTGLGSSEGDFANTNFSSNVDDLVRAADYLRREFEAPRILIGHSLGGAAAIVAARLIPEIEGVATIGAPAEAAHVALQLGDKREEIERAGIAKVNLAGRPFTIKKQFLDDLENQTVLEAARDLARPLLILHAPRDNTVAITNASEIFMAARHPKSFVSLDTADHLLSDKADAQYAAQIVAAWSARYLDDAADDAPDDAPSPAPGGALAPFADGAHARLMAGHHLATELSIDGYPFVIDGAAAEGGDDLGPNPTRVVEGALAACSAMTMRLYAARKGWPLEGADVTVRRAEGADAHVARTLVKTVAVEGPLDEAQRARLEEIAGKCPVHRMLSETVTIVGPNQTPVKPL